MSRRPHAPGWTATALVAVLAALTVVLGGGSASSPAAADEVGKAQQRVARLQALVAATTQQLLRGTRQWEADQAELRVVQLRLQSTRARVAREQQAVDEATRHVGLLARHVYMQPVPGALQVVLTQSPEDVLVALHDRDVVARVAGADGQAILEARRARLALRREQHLVEQYAAQARRIADRSAARLAALKRLASDTAARLDQAQRGLASARAAQAARLARERAARARQLAAAAATCSGRSTAGMQNGNLDPAVLRPLWMAPGHRLRCDAAAAFNRMSQYHRATTGSALCVTDSYRSYGEQVDVYERKPGLAAVPGTSNHGWGLAVDLCGGVEEHGSPANAWMYANAGRFGWYHPSWAEPAGPKPEAWHWEFRG